MGNMLMLMLPALLSLLVGATAAPPGSSTASPLQLHITGTNITESTNITGNTNITENTNITGNTDCPVTTDCEECFSKNTTACIFVVYKENSQGCHDADFEPPNDGVQPRVISQLAQCSDGGDEPVTTLSPHTETTTTNPTTSTTSTSTTTTGSSSTTTSSSTSTTEV